MFYDFYGVVDHSVWSKTGDQGDVWRQARVSLPALDAASTLQLANCSPLIANLITSPLEWNNLLRKIKLDTKGAKT